MPIINILLGFSMGAALVVFGVPVSATANAAVVPVTAVASSPAADISLPTGVFDVPFYSQLRDIRSVEWRKLGCGIASLAMVIEFYRPGSVSVNTLLKEGIAEGAYSKNAGWTHKGLALLAGQYDLKGKAYDLSGLETASAFAQFKKILKDGPVIASVFSKFDPKSPLPHLVVINGIAGGRVYYNDPAGFTAEKNISVADFMRGWKKRFIVIKV